MWQAANRQAGRAFSIGRLIRGGRRPGPGREDNRTGDRRVPARAGASPAAAPTTARTGPVSPPRCRRRTDPPPARRRPPGARRDATGAALPGRARRSRRAPAASSTSCACSWRAPMRSPRSPTGPATHPINATTAPRCVYRHGRANNLGLGPRLRETRYAHPRLHARRALAHGARARRLPPLARRLVRGRQRRPARRERDLV